MGLDDICNCKAFSEINSGHSYVDKCVNSATGLCDDHELVTTCPGLLQGINRVDRMKRWIVYLQFYFKFDDFISQSNHLLVPVKNVGHDAEKMIESSEGKCLIFDICTY